MDQVRHRRRRVHARQHRRAPPRQRASVQRAALHRLALDATRRYELATYVEHRSNAGLVPPDQGSRLTASSCAWACVDRQVRRSRARGAHPRCRWADDDPLMIAYHDDEWGVPERDGRALWEKLMLDGFQAGLSWITILRKRDAFRKAFEDFDPEGRALRRGATSQRLLGQRRHRPLARQDRGHDRRRARLSGDAGGAARISPTFVWSLAGGKPISKRRARPGEDRRSRRRCRRRSRARLQVRRPGDRLRLDAGDRHRQRSRAACFRRAHGHSKAAAGEARKR